MAEENFREAFSLFPACQNLRPHLYPKKQGVVGVVERMIYGLFTKFEFKDIRINGSAKKLSSPISKNTGV